MNGKSQLPQVDEYVEKAVDMLRKQGIPFDSGLTDAECASIEGEYNFRFPPDLRSLLQYAMPVGEKFPNWRGRRASVREILFWPLQGLSFDVEHNNFWLSSWGPRPNIVADALLVVDELVKRAPALIPVFMHRFIPDEPLQAGNPILSVYQADVIYYGNDLPSYLQTEFGVPLPPWASKMRRTVRFWDEIVQADAQRNSD